MTVYSATRCLSCRMPYAMCSCTKEESNAWLKSQEEEDAYWLAEEAKKKPLRRSEDTFPAYRSSLHRLQQDEEGMR